MITLHITHANTPATLDDMAKIADVGGALELSTSAGVTTMTFDSSLRARNAMIVLTYDPAVTRLEITDTRDQDASA